MKSITVSMILVLATAALLGASATDAQVKSTQDYEAEWDKLWTSIKGSVATSFSVAIYRKCRDNSVPSDLEKEYTFAKRLGDESSAEYKCAVEELAKGEDVLGEAVKNADPHFCEMNDIEHFDRIRDHFFGDGQERIKIYVDEAISQCQQGVVQTDQFFAAALRDNAIAGSELLTRRLRNYNSCKILVKNGVSKETMIKLGKWAVEEYKNAKGVKNQNIKRMKEDYHERKKHLRQLFKSEM